jgi:hypothetical protein
MRLFSIVCFLLLVFAAEACSIDQPTKVENNKDTGKVAKKEGQQDYQKGSSTKLRDCLPYTGINGITYKIAAEENFNYPLTAVKDTYEHLDVVNFAKAPFIEIDLNNDLQNDFVCFALATSSNGDNSLKLLVIDGQKRLNGQCLVSEVPHSIELSSSIIGLSRDGLSLRTYTKNGNFTFSRIISDCNQVGCYRLSNK